MSGSGVLRIEQLEDRTTPSAYGFPWPDALHLTLSFVPDQTPAGPNQSQLFRVLDTRFDTAFWQREILRAFQTWVQHANLNIALVADDGLPLGAAGAIQGDDRFGDIRLAAYPMSREVIAVASPFDFLAGTWAGDVKLNSELLGPGSAYDLYSVVLHEAGHALGIGHHDDPDSVMNEAYLDTRAGLSAVDIEALQALYGEREPDEFDARQPNDTWESASLLPSEGGSEDASRRAAVGDLTTAADVDWYRFRVPGGNRRVTIRLHTAGQSLLAGQVTLHDSVGRILAAGSAAFPGSNVELHLDGLRPAENYFIRVAKAADDVFAVGAYRLEVDVEDGSHDPVGGAASEPAADAPLSNDQPSAAVNLQQRIYRTDARFDYIYPGAFERAGDVDYYRFRSPHNPAGAANVMTVMAWPTGSSGARPQLTLYTADGSPVPARVLVNQDGTQVIQVLQVEANAVYLLGVRDAGTDGAGQPRGYFLGIDFGTKPTHLDTFIARQPVSAVSPPGGTLFVPQSRLFHLVLSAEGESGPADKAVRLEVRDQGGNLVLTLAAGAGHAVSTTVFLKPGTYTFQVRPERDGPGTVIASLEGLGLSDPIGPHPQDSTLDPFEAPSDSAAPGDGYWWQAGYHAFLGGGPTGSGGAAPGTSAARDRTGTEARRTVVEAARAVVDSVFASSVADAAAVLPAETAALTSARTVGLTANEIAALLARGPIVEVSFASSERVDSPVPGAPTSAPGPSFRAGQTALSLAPWMSGGADPKADAPAPTAEGPPPAKVAAVPAEPSGELATPKLTVARPPDEASNAPEDGEGAVGETRALGELCGEPREVAMLPDDTAQPAEESRRPYRRLVGSLAVGLVMGLTGGGLLLWAGVPRSRSDGPRPDKRPPQAS
ncbi:MAG TPA: matrixin family metalloprotease [Gemmataceae bacterium]|nr:matrixin family metalloprotease [Gemmataceae bacterium]